MLNRNNDFLYFKGLNIMRNDMVNGSADEFNETQLAIQYKLFQNFYTKIVGRKEEKSASFYNNLKIGLSELEDLNKRIFQTIGMNNVVTSHENISVYFTDNSNETFTSFGKFKVTAKTKQTKSVILRYNLVIKPQDVPSCQEYKITITLNSRVSKKDYIEQELFRGSNKFIYFLSLETAQIKVEYVDVVVAQTFINLFRDWVEYCPQTTTGLLAVFFKRNSYLIPKFGIIFLCLMVFISVFNNISDFDFNKSFGILILSSTVGFYIFQKISSMLLSYLEDKIDSLYSLSYIELSAKDKDAIEKFKIQNNNSIIKVIISGVFSLILGIGSTCISTLLHIH